MTETPTVGTILSRTAALMGGDIGPVLGTLLLFTGLGTLADLAQLNINIVFNFASVGIEYYLIRRLCERGGLISGKGPGGFGAFFGLCVLSGLGILGGFILLIVPAVFLAARWSACGPMQIARGLGVTEAMGESWRRTAPHTLPIALALIVLCIPALVGFVAAITLSDEAGNLTLAPSLIMNFCLFGTMIANWYFGFATFTLVDDSRTLVDVFA